VISIVRPQIISTAPDTPRSHSPAEPRAIGTQDWRINLVLFVALCCRVAWMGWASWNAGDSLEYLQIASGIVTRGRFTGDGAVLSSYRPPVYPALLAVASFLTGHPVATVLGLQAILGAASVVLLFRITCEYCSRRCGLLAAGMLAVAPMTARYAAVLLTETIFVFIVLLAIYTWIRHRSIVSGVLWGAATLTRAATLPFLIIMGTLACVPSLRARRRECCTIALVGLLTVSPWVARNWYRFGRVTVADAGWGLNLLYGTVDLKSGSNRWEQLLTATAADDQQTRTDAFATEQWARRVALDRISSDPFGWVVTRIRQYPRLFIDSGDWLPIGPNSVTFRQAVTSGRASTIVLKAGFAIGNSLVVVLALYGLWIKRSVLIALFPVWSFPVFLAVAHLPMYVEPRYGLPLEPFLILFAAVSVDLMLAS
jgi:4-amino-4-deoxy-L-arabinose transferase-like glycosyltransferase